MPLSTATSPNLVRVPWAAWRDHERELALPPTIRAVPLEMADGPAFSPAQIAAALDSPIDAPALASLASATTTVAIAIDDLTRPTPLADVLAGVVNHLAEAGVAADKITVIVASGAHRPATAHDIEQKIGSTLARTLRVVGHDPHGDLIDSGVLLSGVPVRINRAFLDADVRIGIGAVLPHPFAAFSGGGKIVIPGLADLDVLVRTHKYALMAAGGHELANNRFRREMEAAVRQIGLHWTVNVVVNGERQVAFVAAGDMVGAHRRAAEVARQIGATAAPDAPLDALLLNAYPKDGELLQIEAAFVALRSGMLDWLKPQAPVVLMAACAEGLGVHGLFGPGGRLFRQPSRKGFLGEHPLVIFAEGMTEADVRTSFWSGYEWHASWAELAGALERQLPPAARIGVVPCGPLQLAARRKPVITR